MLESYRFEKLLGESTSAISQFLNCDFQFKGLFDIHLNEDSCYFSYSFKFISFIINEKDKINSITIPFNNIINLKFYNLFIDTYGKPSDIFVKTGKSRVSISQEDDESKSFKQKLKQTFFETKEGTFKDKPSYIIWEKENYTIKMAMFYKENVSTIIFTKVV